MEMDKNRVLDRILYLEDVMLGTDIINTVSTAMLHIENRLMLTDNFDKEMEKEIQSIEEDLIEVINRYIKDKYDGDAILLALYSVVKRVTVEAIKSMAEWLVQEGIVKRVMVGKMMNVDNPEYIM